MAITKEDLLAYQEDKKKELQNAVTNKAVKLDEVEAKVKDYKDNLVAEVEAEHAIEVNAIQAEMKLLDELIAKEAEPEELI